MLDIEYILTHGVFLSLLCAGQGDLSQNLWLPRICYLLQSEREQLSQFWLLLLLSVSFTSELRKKVLPYDAIALGRCAVDILQQTTGGEVALWIVFTVQGWHGLTFYFFPIWMTSWDLSSLPSLQGAQDNKIINSVSSISHILTRGGSPDHQNILYWFRVEGWGETCWVPLFCGAILYDTIGWHGGG